MAAVFVFSEDGALAQQLLTPALELKKALGQPLVAVTADESTAKTLATLGADRVVLLKQATPRQRPWFRHSPSFALARVRRWCW